MKRTQATATERALEEELYALRGWMKAAQEARAKITALRAQLAREREQPRRAPRPIREVQHGP